TDEFSSGKSRSASTVARATKGRYVRAKPSSALKRSPQALRTRSTFSKSTSLAMKAWGDVALERTMCSAVRRRMLENGTTRSPARGVASEVEAEATPDAAAGAGSGAAWAGADGGGGGAAGGSGAAVGAA